MHVCVHQCIACVLMCVCVCVCVCMSGYECLPCHAEVGQRRCFSGARAGVSGGPAALPTTLCGYLCPLSTTGNSIVRCVAGVRTAGGQGCVSCVFLCPVIRPPPSTCEPFGWCGVGCWEWVASSHCLSHCGGVQETVLWQEEIPLKDYFSGEGVLECTQEVHGVQLALSSEIVVEGASQAPVRGHAAGAEESVPRGENLRYPDAGGGGFAQAGLDASRFAGTFGTSRLVQRDEDAGHPGDGDDGTVSSHESSSSSTADSSSSSGEEDIMALDLDAAAAAAGVKPLLSHPPPLETTVVLSSDEDSDDLSSEPDRDDGFFRHFFLPLGLSLWQLAPSRRLSDQKCLHVCCRESGTRNFARFTCPNLITPVHSIPLAQHFLGMGASLTGVAACLGSIVQPLSSVPSLWKRMLCACMCEQGPL